MTYASVHEGTVPENVFWSNIHFQHIDVSWSSLFTSILCTGARHAGLIRANDALGSH